DRRDGLKRHAFAPVTASAPEHARPQLLRFERIGADDQVRELLVDERSDRARPLRVGDAADVGVGRELDERPREAAPPGPRHGGVLKRAAVWIVQASRADPGDLHERAFPRTAAYLPGPGLLVIGFAVRRPSEECHGQLVTRRFRAATGLDELIARLLRF